MKQVDRGSRVAPVRAVAAVIGKEPGVAADEMIAPGENGPPKTVIRCGT